MFAFVGFLALAAGNDNFSVDENSSEDLTVDVKLGMASFTYYSSYPRCCEESPNYDPDYDTEECADYSGCQYMGDLAAYVSPANPEGHVSLPFIQTHNFVALYDNSDPKGIFWASRYANKTIQITKSFSGMTRNFNATIVDTCYNQDCDNCCTKNSKPYVFLVDMEYYTLMRHFGTTDAASGTLAFVIF